MRTKISLLRNKNRQQKGRERAASGQKGIGNPGCIRRAADQYVMRIRPQSGQTQVGPLLMPQRFSRKHSSQIWKPQGQLKQ